MRNNEIFGREITAIRNKIGVNVLNLDSQLYLNAAENIIKPFGFTLQESMSIGTSNLTWMLSDKNNLKYYLSLSSATAKDSTIGSLYPSGFSYQKKYERAKKISEILQSLSVSNPKYVDSGIFEYEGYIFPYVIQEKANGIQLSEIWNELVQNEKIGITKSLKIELNKLRINKTYQPTEVIKWYTNRFELLLSLAETYNLLNPNETRLVNKSFLKLLSKCKPYGGMSILHGDLFQKNVFVQQIDKVWKITDIIDLEISNYTAHTGWDLVLSGWWMSDEDLNNKQILNTFLEDDLSSYFKAEIHDVLLFLELLWYLGVLVDFSLMLNFNKFEKRKTKLLDICNKANLL